MIRPTGKQTETLSAENPGIAKRTTFDRYLLDAVNYVNQKQIDVLNLVQQAVIDQMEEHTSELQSPINLVCRLLLEKKKHV